MLTPVATTAKQAASTSAVTAPRPPMPRTALDRAGTLILSPSHPGISAPRERQHGDAFLAVFLTGDRGFESCSLQRRVWCEPDFLKYLPGRRRSRDTRLKALSRDERANPAWRRCRCATHPCRRKCRSKIRVREQSDLLLLIDAQQGSGLRIGNKTINETPDNYRCIIRFLTVPEDRWSTSVFQQGTNIAAIRQLEDPTRRKIYNAMANSTRYPVIFSSLDKAQENFKIRLAVISFMTNLPTYCQWVGSNNPTMNSKYWTDQPDPSGRVGCCFQTKSGVLASKAMEAIGQDGTGRYLECLATVEIAILYAVERVIGRTSPSAPVNVIKNGSNGSS
jgi:hypothetical protein